MHWQYYHFLLLLFLLWSVTTDCLAFTGYSCGSVERRKKMMKSGHSLVFLLREIPKKGQGAWQTYIASSSSSSNDEWAPIRILVSKEDLTNVLRYCTAVGQVRPNFEGANIACKEKDILTPEKKIFLEQTISRGVKLHTDRLLVQPFDGTLEIPEFPPTQDCYHFTIPGTHRNPGVSGYDMVLYAAAGPSNNTFVVAWASSCASLDDYRPIIGAMYFAPDKSISPLQMTRVTAHEIAHALGFGPEVFKKIEMVTVISKLRGKANVSVMSSSKVIEKTKEHYGCNDIIGMELEDDGPTGTALYHWERRNAKDELMAGLVGAGYYTALTMAAFEDLKFYKANWGMEEPMEWGRNVGCKFLNEKCMNNGITDFPKMFCNDTSKTKRQCTSDRLALGECRIKNYTDNLPEQYQYFINPQIGGNSDMLNDYCPIYSPRRTPEDGGGNVPFVEQLCGEGKWCLGGDSLIIKDSSESSSLSSEVGGVCVEVNCDNNAGTLSVRYAGDNEWHPCPEAGALTPATTSNSFTSGRILCPKYSQVCGITFDGSSQGVVRRDSAASLSINSNLSFLFVFCVWGLLVSLFLF